MHGFEAPLPISRAIEKPTYYLATVVNNVDPLGLDRIQVEVPGLYDKTQGDLPWVGASPQGRSGQNGASWGSHGSPAVGSKVRIELQNDDPAHPVLVSGVKDKPDPEFESGQSEGYRDQWGNRWITKADKSVQFTSSSGVDILIAPDGSLHLKVASDLNVEVGGATTMNVAQSVLIKAASISLESSQLLHNGTNIGSTHVHSGVVSGSDNTLTPH